MITFLKVTLYLSAVYSLMTLIIYLRQDSFIFFPNSARHTIDNNYDNVEEYSFKQTDATLHGWLVNPQFMKQNLIIYYGGNAEDVFHNINDFLEFDTTATLFVNYRGYGSSSGRASESNLFRDATDIYDDIRTRYNPKQIYVFGRSLGSGVATYVASKKTIHGLILVTPYDSLTNMARHSFPWLPTSLLLKHKFNSLQYIQQIKKPILIIYGGRDSIIPNKRTKNLIQHILGPKEIHCIEEADHNTISLYPAFWLKVVSFIDTTSSY